jgi:hypothetical protein
METRNPMLVEGFTSEIPYYMALSDFFIGKPGPGSISEALAMKLPVIVERNSWTMPQERYNAEWVLEKQVGIVLHSFPPDRGGWSAACLPAIPWSDSAPTPQPWTTAPCSRSPRYSKRFCAANSFDKSIHAIGTRPA